jgi:acyl-CoA reductase-like NAD-dependent aldehyde dehydrogenase
VASYDSAFSLSTNFSPVGVVAVSLHWSCPLLKAATVIGFAISAGCTVVLKPHEKASLSVLFLGELIQEVGFPSGVVNIVTGRDREFSPWSIINSFSANFVLPSSEKTVHVVFPDANIDKAVAGIVADIYFNRKPFYSGSSVHFVHKDVFEDVLCEVAKRVAKIKLGSALLEETEMGPLISEASKKEVLQIIGGWVSLGAEIIVGDPQQADSSGYFVGPTVLLSKKCSNSFFLPNEVLAPVLVVVPFSNSDDVAKAITPHDVTVVSWGGDNTALSLFLQSTNSNFLWINSSPEPFLWIRNRIENNISLCLRQKMLTVRS